MSFYHRDAFLPHRFRLVPSSFLQHDGLPFTDVLDERRFQEAFDEHQAPFAQDEDAVYTPPITLWAFLSQVLCKDEQRSCVAAVARVITLLVVLGKKPCAEDTGAYCRARAKLPEPVLERLTCQATDDCETELPERWLWHGRHVKMVDGMDVLRCKTPEMIRREVWTCLLAYNPDSSYDVASGERIRPFATPVKFCSRDAEDRRLLDGRDLAS